MAKTPKLHLLNEIEALLPAGPPGLTARQVHRKLEYNSQSYVGTCLRTLTAAGRAQSDLSVQGIIGTRRWWRA